jgi:hypothetical protein
MMIQNTRSWWMLGLIAAVTLTAACGDDGDDKKDPVVDMAVDMTTGDMGTDSDVPDTDVPDTDVPDTDVPDEGVDMDMEVTPTADVTEVEPNNEIDPDESTPFMAGNSLGGTIAVGGGNADPDIDLFSISLEAGQVFEWEIGALGNGFSPSGLTSVLLDADGELVRILAGDVGAKRQAFIPVDGTYYLQLVDSRANADTVPAHGGPESTYVIKTSVKALAPVAGTVPGTAMLDATDGDLKAFDFTWASSQVFTAEAIGTVDVTEGGFDPELYLWDPTAKEVVAFNGDIDPDNGDYNASLTARLTMGSQYTIIVDAYDHPEDGRFTLTTAETDDSYDAPGELVVGTPAMGVIGAADAAAEKFDSDFFTFVVPAGKTVRVTVTGAGGLQPTAYIPGFFGAIVDTLPVEGSTAFTLNNPDIDDAEYTLILDDIRNIPTDANDAPDYVGGAGFTYTASAEEITWAPAASALPLATASTLPLGEYVWYKVMVPANSILSLNATTDFATGILALATQDEDGFVGLADSGSLYVNRTARELVVGVVDAAFQGTNGAMVYNFTPDIKLSADFSATTFADVADNAANATPATAQALVLPALVTGEATGDGTDADKDHYKVTLTAGQQLVVYTEADPAHAADDMDADTTLEILDAAGMSLAENDDAEGDQAYFSAIIFTAPADGDYTIVVSAYDADSVGYYRLRAAIVD